MITLYKGKRGCGKTLTMVKDGYQFYLDGWKVLRNFHCAFGEYISEDKILELDKNSEIYNCVVMIDEVQIFFDSRRSMRKRNLDFSNFIQQIRKRNIILLGTTQYSNTVDLRFRQHVDVIAYPKFIKEMDVCEVIYVDATSTEDLLLNTIKEPDSNVIVYEANLVYGLYNTEELIGQNI